MSGRSPTTRLSTRVRLPISQQLLSRAAYSISTLSVSRSIRRRHPNLTAESQLKYDCHYYPYEHEAKGALQWRPPNRSSTLVG